ncbi:MAG TPA: valine--tRNA ligase [Phycisphaerae bacterium]|nr:valine--tRNA ligase [Phycisphaerae bacterium]
MAKGESKSYDPASVQERIFKFWQEKGYFHAMPDGRPRDKRFCIMIPLPNVTAALHLGHALNNTLQDILTRLKRMQGCNTLWMVGTDHAGIATQAMVEKTIFEQEKKSRHDLGREEMVRRIWEWKNKFGGRIIEQLKLMGCSCDYQRERFTLDEGCAKAVRHTFFKLFKDGLIYRGKRLVNWDTQLKTAVADDEVYHEEVKGHFYHFKYPVIDRKPGEPEFVHLATTRPETMLGDTAVAVHPQPDKAMDQAEADLKRRLADAPAKEKAELQAALDDIAERRKTVLPGLMKLRDMARQGRKVMLPLVNRPIPLICDEWAKPELGSGCVKITPAHDPNDYEVGMRHKLPMVSVMTEDGKVARIVEPDGTVNPNSPRYEGLRFATKGREKVVEDMQAAGLIDQIEDRLIDIGHSDRSKTPIEPFLSDQWFVKMGDLPPEQAAKIEGLRGSTGLAQLAIDSVKRGEVRFFPARYESSYVDWLTEKRDWCISRQLWWGHRIPVWSRRMSLAEFQNLMASDASASMLLCSTLDNAVIKVSRDNGEQYQIGGAADAIENFCMLLAGKVERDEGLLWHVCVLDSSETWTTQPHPEDARWHPPRKVLVPTHGWLEQNGFVRDPDVLDTWFSSALWPHSTLGWPDADPNDPKNDLGFWYPTNVLITAREIITLWVARMVMTGRYNIGEIPFSDVVIHSVIQDGQGRKMSKTLGNGVDPQDIIDEYGADALRFTLADLATETQDIRLPVKPKKLPDGRKINVSEKFEKGRNFCNKLWQAATGFVMRNLDGYSPAPLDPSKLGLENRWILSRMTACLEKLTQSLERYQFSAAASALYGFMWDEYCSWYIEMSKPRLAGPDRAAAQQVMVHVLDQLLRMLHPLVPFVTEAIWAELAAVAPRRGLRTVEQAEEAVVIAAWPKPDAALRDESIESLMDVLQGIVRGIRDIRTVVNDYRGKAKLSSMRTLPTATVRADADVCQLVDTHRGLVMLLGGCDALEAGADKVRPHGTMSRIIGAVQVFVPVADLIDLSAVRRAEEVKLSELRQAVERAEKQLANASFVERADPEVVAATRQRAEDLSSQIRLIEQHLADLA